VIFVSAKDAEISAVMNALHYYISFPAVETTGILTAKILIFCCIVLTCLDRGTSDVPQKMDNVQHNTGTILMLPEIIQTFSSFQFIQEKSTGVKKQRNYSLKYNVLIQCTLFYCDYICGF
jgi:hypothetical protein